MTIWGDLVKTGIQSITDDEQDAKDPGRGENWGTQSKNVETLQSQTYNSKLKEWTQLLSTSLPFSFVKIKTKHFKICFRYPRRHKKST